MKIINIIKHSAELLGLNELLEILNSEETLPEEEVFRNSDIRKLLNLTALSIQEMCSNYISVYAEQEIETTENKYALNKLPNFIRVVGVYDGDQLVKHKIINRNIVLDQDGKYTVKYCTYPDIHSIYDDIDFLNGFGPDILTMAVCSYYAIAHGMFSEFETFHDTYIEKAQALKELKLFEMPLRRWE